MNLNYGNFWRDLVSIIVIAINITQEQVGLKTGGEGEFFTVKHSLNHTV